jgi:hypothetical protein
MRPAVEDVARALYQANRGKAPMAWEQLKEGAILAPGRQSFYLQTVQAVYAAMDVVDPPPVLLGFCGIYEVYKEGEMRWAHGHTFFSRCGTCQNTWSHYREDGATELYLAHLTKESA